MRNARVFISCGQRDEQEKTIGLAIANFFREKNFETYFAESVHSPETLTENIFKFPNQSEYFVYIDFKRDKLEGKGEYRGSLFVNQEIAIATFLGLEGIGFRQEDTLREGIEGYHIYNAFPFKSAEDITRKLEKETKDWDVNSVNELSLSFIPAAVTRDIGLKLDDSNIKPSDWYHLEVRNRNKKKHAFSCLGYPTKIKNLDTNEEDESVSNELLWSGIGDFAANIMAGSSRDLDAFYVIDGKELIIFHQRHIYTSTHLILAIIYVNYHQANI